MLIQISVYEENMVEGRDLALMYMMPRQNDVVFNVNFAINRFPSFNRALNIVKKCYKYKLLKSK